MRETSSWIEPAIWAVIWTFGSVHNGESAGSGSGSVTSSQGRQVRAGAKHLREIILPHGPSAPRIEKRGMRAQAGQQCAIDNSRRFGLVRQMVGDDETSHEGVFQRDSLRA